jgi:hypothetical protein
MLALACAMPVRADLGALSNLDAVAGLKAALDKGASAAVSELGRTDGFLGNPAVKIPLPEAFDTIENRMRNFAMGRFADELIVTINRAAEAAVPGAKSIFAEAIRKMRVQDAKSILAGGQTAATEYFKRSTAKQLRTRFLPVVKQASAKVKLAEQYSEFVQKASRFGVIKKEYASLDAYVTQKTLDGLFYMVAEEEKKIRRDPAKAGSDTIGKVFGLLK